MDIPADKNTVQALIHRFKEAGVHFVDDARVYLDPSVTIEDGAVIWPNVVLRGRLTSPHRPKSNPDVGSKILWLAEVPL